MQLLFQREREDHSMEGVKQWQSGRFEERSRNKHNAVE